MDQNEHPFIAFLLDYAPDTKGRYLSTYRSFDRYSWEACHDHIQWAFPTKTASAYNPFAPVIPADFVFESDYRVKQAILDLMMNYLASLDIKVESATNGVNMLKFTAPSLNVATWAYSYDHNMKRLTRLIECLGIFDMQAIQRDLAEFLIYDFAVHFSDRLNAKNVVHWVAAWENKQHLFPQT